MLGFLSKLFGGSKSEKDVKKLMPVVDNITQQFASLESISIDELRAKTTEFRQRIKAALTATDEEILAMQNKADALAETAIQEKDELFQEIDRLRKRRDQEIETVLREIHPQAFAVVKEAARRFTVSEEIQATATELDRQLVSKRPHMRIEGDQVFYKRSWMAAGGQVT